MARFVCAFLVLAINIHGFNAPFYVPHRTITRHFKSGSNKLFKTDLRSTDPTNPSSPDPPSSSPSSSMADVEASLANADNKAKAKARGSGLSEAGE